jgi:hypothetical protein
MNVIQISTVPVRIRIETEVTGSGGGDTGKDFELTNLGDEYAVFVKVENTSEPPQNG